MSKINPLYEYGDVKYFRNLHKQRQAQMWWTAVSYSSFHIRLSRWMSLKEAIYTPGNTNMRRNRYNMKPNRLKNLRFRFISFFR